LYPGLSIAERELYLSIGSDNLIDGIQLEGVRTMNPGPGELLQELRRFLVRVDHDARRRLRRLVQPRRVGGADIDPGANRAGEVAHRNRRVFRIGHAARELDALRVFQQVRQQSRDQIFLGLRRVARQTQRQRFVDLAIGVRQLDVEVVDGGRESHDWVLILTHIGVRLSR
jgi:hypothetical protein